MYDCFRRPRAKPSDRCGVFSEHRLLTISKNVEYLRRQEHLCSHVFRTGRPKPLGHFPWKYLEYSNVIAWTLVLVHLHSRRVPGRARCSEAEAWTGVYQYQSCWRRTESKCRCVQMSAVAVGLNFPRFAMLKGIVWSAWPMRCLDTTGGPTPSLSRMSVWLNDTGNCVRWKTNTELC